MTISTPNAANATPGSLSPSPTPSAIALAEVASSRVFYAYLVSLVLTGVLTWMVWLFGNRLAVAVRADADARIAEAGERAARANETAAGANERSKTLEVDLEKQRTRAAEAERLLAEINERTRERHLAPEQRKEFVRMLAPEPEEPIKMIMVECFSVDGETCRFAQELTSVFRQAGQNAMGYGEIHTSDNIPRGILILYRSGTIIPKRALAIHGALAAIGFPSQLGHEPNIDELSVVLRVGRK